MLVSGFQLFSGLTKIGLCRGDRVVVHSSLSSFGTMLYGAKKFIEVLQQIITDEGIIMMPAFTYGCSPFYKYRTKSETGFVSEVFRTTGCVVRSDHPTHSVCVWGNSADFFVGGHKIRAPFSIGSPMYRLMDGGKVLLVGVDYTACSLIHVAQELAKVPYIDRPKKVYYGTEPFIVRRAGCSRGFNKIERYLDNNRIQKIKIGESNVRLAPAKLIVETAVNMLTNDPLSLGCDDPECFSCNEARRMVG